MKTCRSHVLNSLLLVGSCLIAGCSSSKGVFNQAKANSRAGIMRATQFKEKNKIAPNLFWSHFDATKRSAIIYTDSTTKGFKVLAEVTPDAALQKTLELASKASVLGKVDAETQVKTASTIAQLGQRTANVNMLRDALYRLAEGATNRPNTFYGDTAPSQPVAGQSTTSQLSPGQPSAGRPATSQPSTAPAAGCDNCSTLYERLFKETLKTYAIAVEKEAEVSIAQAKAETAKAEAAKAEADAKKATADAKNPKPDSTSSTTATPVAGKQPATGQPGTPAGKTKTTTTTTTSQKAKPAATNKKAKSAS